MPIIQEANKLTERLKRARLEAEGTLKAVSAIGQVPDGRPGFANQAANAPRMTENQAFSTMARRIGL